MADRGAHTPIEAARHDDTSRSRTAFTGDRQDLSRKRFMHS